MRDLATPASRGGSTTRVGLLGADRLHIEGVEGAARRDEEPVLLDATEAEVRGSLRQVDPAEERPVRCVTVHTVKAPPPP